MSRYIRGALCALSVVVAVAVLPAHASAATSCGTRSFDFGRVTVKTGGATSCAFGWETYRAFRRATLRLGRYPQKLHVTSPVTHKRYLVARAFQRINGTKTGDWRYTGVGANGSTLDVRFHWQRFKS